MVVDFSLKLDDVAIRAVEKAACSGRLSRMEIQLFVSTMVANYFQTFVDMNSRGEGE